MASLKILYLVPKLSAGGGQAFGNAAYLKLRFIYLYCIEAELHTDPFPTGRPPAVGQVGNEIKAPSDIGSRKRTSDIAFQCLTFPQIHYEMSDGEKRRQTSLAERERLTCLVPRIIKIWQVFRLY